MGAWSHEAFGNDDALDWVHGLEEVDDLSLIEAALQAVLDDGEGYLEAPQATEALAATELIAHLRGHGGEESCPEVAEDWIARTRLVPPEALVKQALAVLERITGEDSELKELWEESDSGEDWLASVAHLRHRLLAPPQPLAAVPVRDEIAKLVRRIQGLGFALPDFPPPELAQGPLAAVARSQLFSAVVGAEALGEAAAVREGISRLRPLMDPATDAKTLWDLAVREAKTWAAEGRLDEALAALEPWREAAEALAPGTFDSRCMSVFQAAGAEAQAEQLRDRLIAAGQGVAMQRLDRALREASCGSVQAARALLAEHAGLFDNPGFAPWVALVRGILAVREAQPDALELLTPRVEGWAAQSATMSAVWGIFGVAAGWWALALQQAGRGEDARDVVNAVQPLLPRPDNALLIGELKAAGLA
ncbi:hypothetical protein J2X20_001208 [Pelomonas saccharophila]|uniref:DUF4259 domain-containing protein n=1 Tax=Roseateles saccharophilus TaxID=304 RepID=A0ABU1YIA6_ROSSA|nr:DUF4259 domain-containing protein [Roseateles saccharophilus]MDR7268579.1 hypothetical protein [Roseateles saccharophilus]